MSSLAKRFFLAHLALAILLIGAVAAQKLWRFTHHRYDDPASGFYYASVNAQFHSEIDDQLYYFAFRGQSRPRWEWAYTTNYSYDRLEFQWHSFNATAERSEDRGTLFLDSLSFQARENGAFTKEILATWLLGKTNASVASLRGIDAIYNYVLAARDGVLPAPRHHGHRFENPTRGTIHHFRLGIGIAGYVYIWVYIWTLGVLLGAAVLPRSKSSHGSASS